MKKYIHIAKAIKPQLTKEACDLIAEEYAKLRSLDNDENDVARVLFHTIIAQYFFSIFLIYLCLGTDPTRDRPHT